MNGTSNSSIHPMARPSARLLRMWFFLRIRLCSQVFPVVYCLMIHKTSERYIAIFKFIEGILFRFKPTEFMTDYEDGLWAVIQKHWREVPIRGWWFHLKLAVQKKCIKFGLKEILQKNYNARALRTKLVRVPLLPSNQIIEGYASIKEFAHRKQLTDLFAKVFLYFEKY